MQWRRGQQHVGWAPLPPDDIVVAYRDESDVWIFIRARDFDRPRLVDVILPSREVYIEETLVVNQTVVIDDRGPVVAVNPGIPAAIIAAAIGQPIRTYEVRPRILAGTARIRGARVISARDLRQRRRLRTAQTNVRRTPRMVRPAQQLAEPQPLAAGERGRLGDDPPRAARRAGGSRSGATIGAVPARQSVDPAAEARERQVGDDRRDVRESRRDDVRTRIGESRRDAKRTTSGAMGGSRSGMCRSRATACRRTGRLIARMVARFASGGGKVSAGRCRGPS